MTLVLISDSNRVFSEKEKKKRKKKKGREKEKNKGDKTKECECNRRSVRLYESNLPWLYKDMALVRGVLYTNHMQFLNVVLF